MEGRRCCIRIRCEGLVWWICPILGPQQWFAMWPSVLVGLCGRGIAFYMCRCCFYLLHSLLPLEVERGFRYSNTSCSTLSSCICPEMAAATAVTSTLTPAMPFSDEGVLLGLQLVAYVPAICKRKRKAVPTVLQLAVGVVRLSYFLI